MFIYMNIWSTIIGFKVNITHKNKRSNTNRRSVILGEVDIARLDLKKFTEF